MRNITLQIMKFVISIILIQTLFFKFSGAPESVFIFESLGVEPYGRIGSGIIELIAVILLWIPKTKIYGPLLVVSIMLGAILSHIFILGIEIQDDNGLLFGLAVISLICGCSLLIYNWQEKKP